MELKIVTEEEIKPLLLRIKQLEERLEQLTPSNDGYMSLEDVMNYFSYKSKNPIYVWVKQGLLKRYYPDGNPDKDPRFKREEVEKIFKEKKQPFFT